MTLTLVDSKLFTLMWRHPVAEAAALLALAPELVAVGLSQLGAVVEHVIAGVGGGGGHTLAQATALGAVVFDIILRILTDKDILKANENKQEGETS